MAVITETQKEAAVRRLAFTGLRNRWLLLALSPIVVAPVVVAVVFLAIGLRGSVGIPLFALGITAAVFITAVTWQTSQRKKRYSALHKILFKGRVIEAKVTGLEKNYSVRVNRVPLHTFRLALSGIGDIELKTLNPHIIHGLAGPSPVRVYYHTDSPGMVIPESLVTAESAEPGKPVKHSGWM